MIIVQVYEFWRQNFVYAIPFLILVIGVFVIESENRASDKEMEHKDQW